MVLGGLRGSLAEATAKTSSVRPNADTATRPAPVRRRLGASEGPYSTWRTPRTSEIAAITIHEAPTASSPTRANWLAPEKTISDIATVSATLKPAPRAATPNATAAGR